MSDFKITLAAGALLASSTAVQAAEDSCRFEEWLLRMAYQTETVVADFAAGGRSRHQTSFATTLKAIEGPGLRRAMVQDGYEDYETLVGQHVATARALLGGTTRGSTRAEQVRALTASTAQLLAAVTRIDCASRNAQQARAAALDGSKTAGASGGNGMRLSIDWSVMLALLLGVGVLAGLLLAERWTRFRKRNDQRFVCDIPCQVTQKGATRDSRIVDISAAGAKLQIGLEGNSEQVDIKAAGFETAGRVVWANSHYCGVIFDRPLSQGVLQEAVAGRVAVA
ncbi:PilZ domain-containing protein [Marinovum sp.]|uniref:PilZ domain-containing protein n=1 Tax=Marinovum sp. TaxID=2024839 RepID=UPI003A8EE16E